METLVESKIDAIGKGRRIVTISNASMKRRIPHDLWKKKRKRGICLFDE
jgi:hypothetical protein